MAKSITAILNLKDNFSNVLNKTTANTKQFQRQMKQVSNTAKDMKTSVLSTFSKLTAGFALGSIAKQSIMLASDLNEVQNVVDVTFGDGAKQINEFAKSALQSFGITELQAKKFNGTLGALMKSSGVSSDKLIDMSTSLTGLSADFASFYNLAPEEAFEKIKSGISGETEPLKALGINMSVANLNAYALSQGINKTTLKMTQGEQTLLRYNYLMSVSKDAQGDFSRTSLDFANQLTILSSTLKQIGANIAKFLLPSLNKGLIKVNEFTTKISTFIESFDSTGAMDKFNIALGFLKENSTLIMVVLGALVPMIGVFKLFSPFSSIINEVGFAFGSSLLKMTSFKNILLLLKGIPMLILSPFNLLKGGFISLHRTFVIFTAFLPNLMNLSTLGSVFKSLLNPMGLLKGAFGIFKSVLMSIFSPFNLIILAIGLVVASVIYCWNTNSVFRENMIAAWDSISASVMNVVGIIISWLQQLKEFYITHQEEIHGIMDAIFNLIGAAISQIIIVITGIIAVVSEVFSFIDALIHGDWSKMWESCKNIVKIVIDTILKLWDGLKAGLKSPIKAVVNIFKKEDKMPVGESVDGNATGTNYFRGGYTWVGEHGPELMNLPSGTQIKTNSQSMGMNSNNQSPIINVTVQGNVVGNESFINQLGNAIYSKVSLALVNS